MGIFRQDPQPQPPQRHIPIATAGDEPPRMGVQLAALMALTVLAWPQENLRLTQKQSNPPKIAAVTKSVDNPPFRGMHGMQRPDANYRAWTPRLWDAIQPPASGGGPSPVVVPADDPPPRRQPPPTLLTSWEPELFIQLPDQAGATLPIQGDDPPRIGPLQRNAYATILRSWEPPFTYRRLLPVRLESQGDNPPLRRLSANWSQSSWEIPFFTQIQRNVTAIFPELSRAIAVDSASVSLSTSQGGTISLKTEA